jgi:hypothetical protein
LSDPKRTQPDRRQHPAEPRQARDLHPYCRVRHLCAPYELGEDKLYGRIRPPVAGLTRTRSAIIAAPSGWLHLR